MEATPWSFQTGLIGGTSEVHSHIHICYSLSKGIVITGVSERVPEKLGSEAVPVQNRQAAQKLLERRTDAGPGFERGRGRGRGFRRGGGRYDADDQNERVMTLDEWEARKSTPSSSRAISDQELAMKLQEQFNMEDSHVRLPLFMFTAVGI